MKILYSIQGTGNGHLARAYDVYTALSKHGDVDVLVSGIQGDIDIPIPIKYKLYGMSFIFGKKGSIDIWNTLRKLKLIKFLNDILRLPVKNYDLIINDFEAISAWACKLKKKPCISLSHQCAVIHPNAPKPLNNDFLGETVLKYYAPSKFLFGFHFISIGEKISTPIIRQQIRKLKITDNGHYTVYLPAYDSQTIVQTLSLIKNVEWEVFCKHSKEAFEYKNISIKPIDQKAFLKSLSACKGILCGAGFETPAEALYLGKKLLVIPMLGQYEQQCNAATLKSIGVKVLDTFNKHQISTISEWIDNTEAIQVSYPDNAQIVVDNLINYYHANNKGLNLKSTLKEVVSW